MAFVAELDWLARESQKRHGSTRGTYFVFERDGVRYLQIDTYGSRERLLQDKVSQSIQIGPEIARLLIPELQKVAGTGGTAATPNAANDPASKAVRPDSVR